MVTRSIVVCADDYGISEGTSATIRELLEAGAINATTCLVESASWPDAARALRELAARKPGIGVGLHLNLTDPFSHGVAKTARASLPRLLVRAVLPPSRAAVGAVYENFRAQWEDFIAQFGRAPDFVDGHQHVHLFAASRAALFRLLREKGFQGWLRQCRASSGKGGVKDRLLAAFSRPFVAEARRAGFALNPGFGGLRNFDLNEDLAALWRSELAAMDAGGLLMVHPGQADSPEGSEAIDKCRVQEAEFLGSAQWRTILAATGSDMSADAVHPW
jgi:hypothetical protein